MKIEIKNGDWVKGYHAGYYQVVGFGASYAFEDVGTSKKGEKCSTLANLKQGFTSKMKFKLGADAVALEWLKPVSEEVLRQIEDYWKENPEKKEIFDRWQVVEQLGDLWYQLNIYEEGIEFWQEKTMNLPKKINYQQFAAWFDKTMMDYGKLYDEKKSRRRKKLCFVSTKVIPESVSLGKVPLYEHPIMIVGD